VTNEEALFAYIDGELEGEERARIEAEIAADPALQKIVAEHRALAAELQSAFSTVLDAPVPPALSMSAATDAPVVSLAEERSRRDRRRASWGMSHWAAMAATLVAGLIGGAIFNGGSTGPVTERDGQLVASSWLEDALDTQLASTQSASDPVRIGMTFRKNDGAICRSFAVQTAEGVACREGKLWQLEGLLHREPAQTGDYRLASSFGAAELVDGLIAGEALDQEQERAAREAGWKPAKTP